MPERPPFDPSRIRHRAQPPAPVGEPGAPFTVREITQMISATLARHLPATVHVLGEIGNLSRPVSGHLYFTLKDVTSELRCAMWRSSAARLKFEPEVGMEVIASGSIEVYAPRGTYQLMVRRLEPRGIGALELAFRQLRERLEREGLFDAARKRPLPRFPERIALVTSPSGAAIRDILHTLARRFPPLEILVYPVRVQGSGAAEEIAAAIEKLNAHAADLGGIDLLITGRGGGSLEDLWAFNEEVVARAIAASRIPVVSAVGHEVDVSISDLVADLRAATPTAAAELITPSLTELIELLQRQAGRAHRAAHHHLQLLKARLQAALAYDGLARPLLAVRQHGQLLDELQHRARSGVLELVRRQRARFGSAELALLRFGAGTRFAQIGREVDACLRHLGQVVANRALSGEQRLARVVARVERSSPAPALKSLDSRLSALPPRLVAALKRMLAYRRRLLSSRLQSATACHPRQVLKRGFSITREAATRRVIRSIRQVRDRMRTTTEVTDGEFRSTADDPRQGNLFD